MIDVNYALIIRDEAGKQITVVGTGRELVNQRGKIHPKFHTFCLSAFRLYPGASTIDIVTWHPSIDLDQAPLVLTAKRTDQTDMLGYHFPSPEEVQTA